MNKCYDRPDASGDIYVRMLSLGVQWQAQELGGEWTWDHVVSIRKSCDWACRYRD
jgi:hypothetical protein